MTLLTLLSLFLLGALVGGLGGLFGIGGGLIAIPVLALVFDMDQQLAQGTAMVMVVPNVLLGLWRNYQLGNLNRRSALILSLSAVLCTYFAALVALSLPSATLRLAFAIFIALVALQFIWRTLSLNRVRLTDAPQETPPNLLHRGWLVLVGAFGGSLSGLFGIGGALFAPPALTSWFGMRQAVAQAHALALVAPGTLVALSTYAAHQEVDWYFGVPMAVGGAISVSYGVRLAHRLPEKSLRLLFSGFLLLTTLFLFTGL